MHVDNAAPKPVPVQTRIPRLYSVEVFDTPANWWTISLNEIRRRFPTDFQLPCPNSGGRISDQLASEVALDTADQEMFFRVYPFPAACASVETNTSVYPTHEIIPNAWYSMTDALEILASNPCCIPRSNRRITTFGEG